MEFVVNALKGRLRLIVESFTLLLSLFIFAMITVYSLQDTLYCLSIGDTHLAV